MAYPISGGRKSRYRNAESQMVGQFDQGTLKGSKGRSQSHICSVINLPIDSYFQCPKFSCVLSFPCSYALGDQRHLSCGPGVSTLLGCTRGQDAVQGMPSI